MQAITRYIFSQLLAVTLGITLVSTTVFFLVGSLRWIGYIVNRGLPASAFFYFIGLLLPSFMSLILPIAAFCAALIVSYKLVMDSELVVLRTPRRTRRGLPLAQAAAP